MKICMMRERRNEVDNHNTLRRRYQISAVEMIRNEACASSISRFDENSRLSYKKRLLMAENTPIPSNFTCPITQDIMDNPVLLVEDVSQRSLIDGADLLFFTGTLLRESCAR